MPKLSLMFDNKIVKEVSVGTRPVTIGRSPDNDLPVDNLAVSNHHAKVYYEAGRMVVLLDRGDYWQCAFLIPKGAFDNVKRAELSAFRRRVAESVPVFADRVDELKDWNQVKLLTVAVDRLERWYRPGLLCIGDAAHARSPIGGVGVNLAGQDAVAAANLLWQPLKAGTVNDNDLQRVQKRREIPTRITQRMQVIVQNNVIDRALDAGKPFEAPLVLRLADRFAPLRRIPPTVPSRMRMVRGSSPACVTAMGSSSSLGEITRKSTLRRG